MDLKINGKDMSLIDYANAQLKGVVERKPAVAAV